MEITPIDMMRMDTFKRRSHLMEQPHMLYGTQGELKEVQTPTQTISYEHNANNQRVAKKVNGTVVEKYLWVNLTTLLATYDANDNLKQRFEYAAPQGHFLASSEHQRMPVSMTNNGTKYYLHYDQVGSLRAVSDTSGNIVKEVSYDSYGNIVSDSDEAFTVPFGFAGGDSNLYGYVLGDPVNFVDPDGLMSMRVPPSMLPKEYRPYVPKKPIPKGKNGEHKPDCDLPHTQLGIRNGRKGPYPQSKEWGAKGDRGYDNNTPKDLKDWTNHGRPKNHPDPHRHPYNPNTGKKGSPEPIRYPPDMI